MGFGDGQQFMRGFSERDQKGRVAIAHRFDEELEGERGFSGARFALDQIDSLLGQATVEDDIKLLDAGADSAGRERGLFFGRAGGLSLSEGWIQHRHLSFPARGIGAARLAGREASERHRPPGTRRNFASKSYPTRWRRQADALLSPPDLALSLGRS